MKVKGDAMGRWSAGMVAAVVAAGALFCETGQSDGGGAVADEVEDLRLTVADVSGWTERAHGSFTGWGVYEGNALTGESPIDGAGDIYVAFGVVTTGMQYLESPPPSGTVNLFLDAYVMDFGTAEKAMAMYEELRPASGTAVGGEDDSVAIIDESTPSFGCMLYAHYGKFYIELKFNNYTTKSEAVGDAGLFLSVYKAKIVG